MADDIKYREFSYPYKHSLGIDPSEIRQIYASQAYSGPSLEKSVERDKVSYLKDLGKVMTDIKVENKLKTLNRQAQTMNTMSKMDEYREGNVQKKTTLPGQNNRDETSQEIKPLIDNLQVTKTDSRFLRKQIKIFLKDTYNLTEKFLRKQ